MSNIIDNRADKNGLYLTISNTNAEAVSGQVNQLLTQRGYRIEAGAPNNGIYGKGNKTMRILFGAFVKRYAFDVRVKDEAGGTLLHFVKNEKRMVGGAIGMNQVTKESNQIRDQLRQMF